MAANYDAIREGNIKRYGWDDAVLNLLGHLYSERPHFIFELLQNAEDAHANEVTFELFQDRLEVRHDGRRFDEADVIGLCGVGQSTKREDLTRIGKFGIGFKSVYAYTRTPQIHSGDEHFKIERYVRPFAIESLTGLPVNETLFVFPFDRDEPSAEQATAEISAALSGFDLAALLFLRRIERVRVLGAGTPAAVLERIADTRPDKGRHIVLERRCGENVTKAEWRAWERSLETHGHAELRTEIAFQVEEGSGGGQRVVATDSSPLVVFFPTEKETFLGFLMQGPFRTTPARDNVPRQDPWNQMLVRETGVLLSDALECLRQDGLLTADALQTLPLDSTRFEPESMFRPIFEAARAALTSEPLIPVAGSEGHATAADLKLARGTGLRELLSPDQLTLLYGKPAPPSTAVRTVSFAHDSITQDNTPELWRYLRDELTVDEVTPRSLATRLSLEFLTAQSDEWIVSMYEFLRQNLAVWRAVRFAGDQPGPARGKPIIRLEDGSHINPFTDTDQPAAYLPGVVETGFPTVRRTVAERPEAERFLRALGFTTPDAVAEVLDNVLPQYQSADCQHLDPDRHAAHLDSIELALAQAPAQRREQLRRQLNDSAFLIANNTVTGESRLAKPPEIYQRTDALEMYFEGNPEAWFLDPRYERWPGVLASVDIRSRVAISARTGDFDGHVTIQDFHGVHERGLHGFDKDAKIAGLEFAVANPNRARSEFIWNVLLVPSRNLVSGEIEESSRQDFSRATRTATASEIGTLAMAARWLPGPDGAFHRPRDLLMKDLPESYRRDDVLGRALGMMQPLVEEASRELNVPSRVLRALSEDPELVSMIEKRLADRSAHSHVQDSPDAQAAAEPVDYGAELATAFGRLAEPPRSDAESVDQRSSGLVNNPQLRRDRTREDIEEGIERETPPHERFRLVPKRIWDIKDTSVKHFLLEQYKGACQICSDTFTKRDGSPYFEGLYLVSRIKGRWLDRPGNVLALCATCCAKFQHGSVEAQDIINQIVRWRTVREGGSASCLSIRLCGESVQLVFTEKHLFDLQEMIRAGK